MTGATNWNKKKLSPTRVVAALNSYEDRNSESATSHANWKSAMRALEGNFDDAIGRAVTELHDEYQTSEK